MGTSALTGDAARSFLLPARLASVAKLNVPRGRVPRMARSACEMPVIWKLDKGAAAGEVQRPAVAPAPACVPEPGRRANFAGLEERIAMAKRAAARSADGAKRALWAGSKSKVGGDYASPALSNSLPRTRSSRLETALRDGTGGNTGDTGQAQRNAA